MQNPLLHRFSFHKIRYVLNVKINFNKEKEILPHSPKWKHILFYLKIYVIPARFAFLWASAFLQVFLCHQITNKDWNVIKQCNNQTIKCIRDWLIISRVINSGWWNVDILVSLMCILSICIDVPLCLLFERASIWKDVLCKVYNIFTSVF